MQLLEHGLTVTYSYENSDMWLLFASALES